MPLINYSGDQSDGDLKDLHYVKKYSIPTRWDLTEVHKTFNGEGITIAVLDSAININHEVFSENVPNGKKFHSRNTAAGLLVLKP